MSNLKKWKLKIENENLFENINKFCENPKNKLASGLLFRYMHNNSVET